MMNPLETFALDCPWCAAPIEIDVDLSGGDQSYVEDCQVCCSPILVRVRIGTSRDEAIEVTLAREGV